MKRTLNLDRSTSLNAILASIRLRIPIVGDVTVEDLRRLLVELRQLAEELGIRIELRIPSAASAAAFAVAGAALGTLVALATSGGAAVVLFGACAGACLSCIRVDVRPAENGLSRVTVA